MARQFSLLFQVPRTKLLAAATDAAGRTSNYFSLKNAHKAWLVCEVNQGNAATVAFTPLQATAVAGTSSKAIANTPIYANQDQAAGDAMTAQTAAANFTTSAALKDKVVIFEIIPEDCMDMANGFDCLALQTGASNAANITSAYLHVFGRYQQATPPTALTD